MTRASGKTPKGKTGRPDRDIKNWINCSRAWTGQETQIQRMGSAGFWNKAWKEHTHKDRPVNLSFDQRKNDDRANAVLDMLKETGFCVRNMSVLDIGCGPGILALPLARAGARVTALDISAEALRHVKEKAEREGSDVETLECSWWDADIDDLGLRNRFDLVIASMTPSVKDLETFTRITECSRHLCYYSGSLPGGRNPALDEIYKTILGPEYPHHRDKKPLFMYYFMYLYLNGYRPVVRVHHYRESKAVGWEDAADQAVRFVDRAKPCSVSAQRKIRNYYRGVAVDGKVSVRSDGYLGMMVWDKNHRQ